MTELYTVMRYLQSDLLKEVGIQHFDEWAADFGRVTTDLELWLLCTRDKLRFYAVC